MLQKPAQTMSLGVLLVVLTTSFPTQAEPMQKLLQMLDYVGVDYPPTVQDGLVVDDVEYAEMNEFSAEIVLLLKALPETPGKANLVKQGDLLLAVVKERKQGQVISVITMQLEKELITVFNIKIGPEQVPDMSSVQSFYEVHCSSCHGVIGLGDGPVAEGMQPAPANFHEMQRQYQRSVYDLYNTITLGVSNTSMGSFSQFSEDERWALALYVSQFSSTDEQRNNGEQLWYQGVLKEKINSISTLTGTSLFFAGELAELEGYSKSEGEAVLAYLRSNPEVLEISDHVAIDKSIEQLAKSVAHVRNGDRIKARKAALSAYLDGFELAEASVAVVNRELKTAIEKEMIEFRLLIKNGTIKELTVKQNQLISLLNQAKSLLNTTQMSPTTAFVGAFIILLREGIEAILVLAAIIASLVKTGRTNALKYIHAGWVSAVVLGIGTWWLADNIISISGASRELTEGIAALFAAAILIYVGFWLHNASNSKRWQAYVEHKVDSAMEGSTLWALAIVAFLAVYREMFETVLFYQSMWLQVGDESQQGFILGIVAAIALLVVLSFVIFKTGMRLPIRTFFQVNAVLLFVLAVVFSGQGISALQETGLISITLLDLPTVEILGFYPTLQGIGLQVTVLLVGVYLFTNHRNRT